MGVGKLPQANLLAGFDLMLVLFLHVLFDTGIFFLNGWYVFNFVRVTDIKSWLNVCILAALASCMSAHKQHDRIFTLLFKVQ